MRLPRALVVLVTLASLSACSTNNASDAGETGTSATDSGDGDGDGDGDPQTGDGDPDPNCTPELEALRAEIFTPGCALASCHASADAAGGLDLETADLEGQLIGQPSGTCDGWIRVIPGAPDESLLYTKVAGPAPCGNLMPPPGGLPPEQAACLRTWIETLDPVNCETCGGEACVDLDADTQHCGACDNACPAGVSCVAGDCSCPAGQELCGDVCLDTQADLQNCGGCDDACAPNKVCWMGVCADTCGDLTACGGGCVDTQTNPDHCGGCDNTCDMGNACDMGGCGCPGDGVSFVDEVEPLLVDSCAGMGCHGAQAAAGLDLRVGNTYAELVSVPSSQCNNRLRVAPGQPANSYLMDKLLGVNLCFGTKMPKGGSSLSDAQIAMVSEWICRGANP
jgi:hypothetical protein